MTGIITFDLQLQNVAEMPEKAKELLEEELQGLIYDTLDGIKVSVDNPEFDYDKCDELERSGEIYEVEEEIEFSIRNTEFILAEHGYSLAIRSPKKE